MFNKPLISVCLITYNQEKYVGEAIDGLFNQSYMPLEIVISDDCSTDNTFSIIEKKVENYNGKHKINVSRNEKNLGLVCHVNKVILELASGEYISLAAGDDVFFPNNIEDNWEVLKNNSNIIASAGLNISIDENGKILNSKNNNRNDFTGNFKFFSLDNYINNNLHISHRTFHKSVMSFFGPLNKDCPTEDTTMLLRSFLLGKVVLIDKPTGYYRIHKGGISFKKNIFKLPYENIYNQYITDVNFAFNNNVINEKTKERLMSKFKVYKKKQELNYKIGLENSIYKLFFLLMPKIIFSKNHNLKEKIVIIKKYFHRNM